VTRTGFRRDVRRFLTWLVGFLIVLILTLLLFLRFQWTRAWISTSVYHQALEGVCGQLSDREDNLELRKAIGTWQLAVAPELQAAG